MFLVHMVGLRAALFLLIVATAVEAAQPDLLMRREDSAEAAVVANVSQQNAPAEVIKVAKQQDENAKESKDQAKQLEDKAKTDEEVASKEKQDAQGDGLRANAAKSQVKDDAGQVQAAQQKYAELAAQFSDAQLMADTMGKAVIQAQEKKTQAAKAMTIAQQELETLKKKEDEDSERASGLSTKTQDDQGKAAVADAKAKTDRAEAADADDVAKEEEASAKNLAVGTLMERQAASLDGAAFLRGARRESDNAEQEEESGSEDSEGEDEDGDAYEMDVNDVARIMESRNGPATREALHAALAEVYRHGDAALDDGKEYDSADDGSGEKEPLAFDDADAPPPLRDNADESVSAIRVAEDGDNDEPPSPSDDNHAEDTLSDDDALREAPDSGLKMSDEADVDEEESLRPNEGSAP